MIEDALPQESTAPQSAPAPEGVFWGYREILIFLGLVLPSLLFGALFVRTALWAAGVTTRNVALVALPAQFVGFTLLFVALYAIVFRPAAQPFWRSLAWVPSALVPVQAATLGASLALAVGIVGVLLRTPDINSPLKQLLSTPAGLVLVALFGTTLGPLFEELAFRGFLQPVFVRSLGAPAGIALQAVPFGILHLQQNAWSWQHGLLIAVAGAAFGYVRYRTGSTRTAAIMHAAYNATFFVILLLQKKPIA